MSVPRTNFREGDRVRGAEWFEKIAGVTGTVVKAILVTGNDWAAQDLLVRFDRPVTIFEGEPPMWTFFHSAHNFEYLDEAVETRREMEAISDTEDPPSSPRALPSFPLEGRAFQQPMDIMQTGGNELQRCSQCNKEKSNPGCFYLDKWYCSSRCRHDAGDRTACLRWDCGCTRYAKKRRLLRRHRDQMRIMDDFIRDQDLEDEMEERLIESTGDAGFFLGSDSEMDEASDKEDPELELRREANEKLSFIQAANDMLAPREMARDLDRTRMQLEDLRSQVLR